MTGEGDSGGPRSIPGDLYVQIDVEPHPVFTRDGNDVHSEVEIAMTRAALGGEIEIETLYGIESIKLNAGTQPNDRFRLRGKGVPFLRNSGQGDHFVHIRVKVPESLNGEQKRLLQQLDESLQ